MAWSARCGSVITAAAGPATATDRQQTTNSDATRWRVVPMRATPFRASARPSERPRARRSFRAARPVAGPPCREGSFSRCVAEGGLARPFRAHSCGTAPVSDRTSPPRRVCGRTLAGPMAHGFRAERPTHGGIERRTLLTRGGGSMDPVRTLDTGIASGVVTVLVDEPGGGSSTIQTPAAEFEAADRGVAIGRRFIPWHRVRRYEWDLPPKEFAEEHRVSARVRLVLDDVNGTAEEHMVSADGFETGAFAVTMLLEDFVDTARGTVMVRRVG